MGQMANEPDSQGLEQQVDNSQGQQETQETGTGINPAWNDLLSGLPSSLHSTVIPHLQQWDKNYQEGLGKVHSQYEPYKAYVDQGIEPDQINYALQVLQAIQDRPQEVFAAMQQFYGQQQELEEPDLEEQGQNPDQIDISQHPQFQQMQGMLNAVAELLVQQNSASQEQQEDEALDQEFEEARQQFGDFDEKYVMGILIADAELGQGNMTVAQAVQQYQELINGIKTDANRPGPPKILSGSGASAQVGTNPAQLDDKGRRNLVAQMLAAGKTPD